MDLKKNKKLKRKYDAVTFEYKKWVGLHIYRSKDKNAPFAEWERITEVPRLPGLFRDEEAERNWEFYYYKLTEVDVHGNESDAFDGPDRTETRDGKKYTITAETFIAGLNLYWSIDPDLPLDQWARQNEELIKQERYTGKCPVKEPYYFYGKFVNALGDEFGQPSPPQRIVPRP